MTDETQRPDDTRRTDDSIWARPKPKPPEATGDQTVDPTSEPPVAANGQSMATDEMTSDESASQQAAATAEPSTAGEGSSGVTPATMAEATADASPADGTDDAQESAAAAAALPFDVPQPPVWEPTDADLDPTSDAGWQRAADHELVAVRPENIPAIIAVASAGVLDPATARDVVAGKPVEEAIAAQGLSPGTGASEGSMATADRSAWSAMPGFASPFGGGGHGMPATTPQRAQPPEAAETSGPAATTGPATTRSATTGPAGTTELPASVAPSDVAAAAAMSPATAEAESAAIPGSAPASNVIAFPQPAPETALAPSERRWRRAGRRARSGLEAAARPVLLLALFILGTSVGWTSYLATRPAPVPAAPAQVVDSAATDAVPPQVQSLVAALNSGNQSQVQTVVPADAYRLLAGELASNNVQSIRAAKAQATYSAGQDSATEILIAATTLDGQNFTFNLVVHLHNGVITEFR